MAGEKLSLLIISKSKSPRCFRGIKSLPLEYTANAKAWMTGEIFQLWLEKWNRKLCSKNRNILLVMDNCAAHPRGLNFTNINIKFLPSNTTSKLQPCDQGIIQSLKVHYRHQLLRATLQTMENGNQHRITVLDAMQWLKIAWDKVTSTTIMNCFRHCSFIIASQSEDDNDSTSPIQVEADEILDELRRQHGLDSGVSFQDFLNFDNTIETSGSLTDEEIASMVHEGHATQNDSEETSEDYDEPVQCPTVSEYHLALDVVKRFITCNGESPHLQAFSCLDDLLHSVQRKSKKQTRITEFITNSVIIFNKTIT